MPSSRRSDGNKKATEVMHYSQEEVERLVQERTRELEEANEALRRVIDERQRAEVVLHEARKLAEDIVDTVREPMLVLDVDLRVQSANASFYRNFQVESGETVGRLVYELGNSQWNIPALRELLENVLPQNKVFNDFEVRHDFEKLGQRTMLLNARRIDHMQLILLAIEDITERKQAEEELEKRVRELRESEDRFRQMASRLTLAEQEERHRIGQILHDDLQQFLYGIQLRIEFINQGIETGDQEQVRREAQRVTGWIEEAIAKTRQLTVDYSPPILPQEGLVDALGWLVTQMRELHGLQVEVEAEHRFFIADEGMRILLFHLIRELLFNVVKHAKTDRARVVLREEADGLVIRVSDEGQGFEVGTEREHGFGLRRMWERLSLVGGRVEIASSPGAGTQVTIYAPVTPNQRP